MRNVALTENARNPGPLLGGHPESHSPVRPISLPGHLGGASLRALPKPEPVTLHTYHTLLGPATRSGGLLGHWGLCRARPEL